MKLYNGAVYFELAVRLGDWSSAIGKTRIFSKEVFYVSNKTYLIITWLHSRNDIFIRIMLMMYISLHTHTYSGFSLLRLLEVPFKITSIKK